MPDDRIAPFRPGVPRVKRVEERALCVQDPFGLEGCDGADELALSAREVVEQLALARGRARPYVIQARRSHTPGEDQVGRGGHDPGAGGGRAEFLPADLDGSAAVSARLAAEATALLGGRIDVLVNSAGIFPRATTAGTDEATFDQVYAVNVKAPFFLTAAIAPAMAAQGGGAVINLGSWIARLGIPISALYSSTKGAVETLTRGWAAEVGPSGVRVHTISPGCMLTQD